MDDLTAAQEALAAALGRLAPDDWTLGSPCPEWDVAGVVRHLVVGERAFTTSLGGAPYDLVAIDAAVSALPAPALASAYAEGAGALRAALAAAGPGDLPTGLGPLPASAIASIRLVEALVHGWDVATATGRPLVVADAVVERGTEAARRLRESVPEPERRFGVLQPVADSAPPLARLAALMGRLS